MNLRNCLPMVWSLALVIVSHHVVAADAPAPPATSTYAPADDLVRQVKLYLVELDEALAAANDFESTSQRAKKDANTLVVLALALGLHDTDNEYKSSAASLMQAAQTLSRAADYDQAKAALAALHTAAEGKVSNDAELHWEKVASLGQLMKQVTFIHNRLRRSLAPRRFEEKAEENARYAALLAVVGQAALVDTHEVKDPADLPQWYQFSAEMRDAAGQVNAEVHAGNAEGSAEAMKRLEKSCQDCHAVFRQDLL